MPEPGSMSMDDWWLRDRAEAERRRYESIVPIAIDPDACRAAFLEAIKRPSREELEPQWLWELGRP